MVYLSAPLGCTCCKCGKTAYLTHNGKPYCPSCHTKIIIEESKE